MKKTLPGLLYEEYKDRHETFLGAIAAENLSLPEDERIQDTIKTVFALSEFVARNCIRTPAMLIDLVRSRDLTMSYEPRRFHQALAKRLAGCGDETTLRHELALFRQREMVRIAWRDLAGWANLDETLEDLTAFADACVDHVHECLYAWQCHEMGAPRNRNGEFQGLVVIGMGKLGAGELNFSSDIDLVFAYPEKGKTAGGPESVENEVFFLSLARRLIHVLGASGGDQPLFRVDMRLRPYGENGPLVMSFDAMEEYYQQQGREWERYAWLRARVVAGDRNAGKKLLIRLQPFIFRRYLDYTVFDALREMKHKISIEVKRRAMADNLKLGPGGIRELEFFCQVFQILRGGVMPVLQERHTGKLLSTLESEGVIEKQSHDDLAAAYAFLRSTENHLQEMADRQTHTIPEDETGRLGVAVSMGCASYAKFADVLAFHRKNVHRHFNQVLAPDIPDHAAGEDLERIWQDPGGSTGAGAVIRQAGFAEPEKVVNALKYLKQSPETRSLSLTGRKRIDRLIPRLIKAVGPCDNAEGVFSRLVDLIRSIQRRTSYIALLLENPSVLTHLILLAEKSPWIITFLARHPVLLDEFLDPRSLYSPPARDDLKHQLVDQMRHLPQEDLEYQIEALCIFKQTNTLRVAAADVTDVLPIKRVSDHLTEIAETLLEKVLDLAWNFMTQKHGTPVCRMEHRVCENGFLVVGYGKFGGIEMGYQSDLDLVFLHAGTQEVTTDTDRPIDSAYFFSRLGQRVVHLLSAHTRAGKLYEADMRLRPSGNAGPLVSHVDAFFAYQEQEGWTWEHQALVRARPICGDPALAGRFDDIRRRVLGKKRDEAQLKTDISAMREKMRKERLRESAGTFDLKQGHGGIVDIEFLVQYFVLLKSCQYARLLDWTDNVRILETLRRLEIMDVDDAETLHDAYLAFRTAIHRLSLQEKAARVDADAFAEMRRRVVRIWNDTLAPA